MKGLNLLTLTGVSALTLTPFAANAIIFDADVVPDVIFGSGNDNGSFTVDRHNGVELGLRAKLRYDGSGNPQNVFNSNGDGTYTYNAGAAPLSSSSTAEWNVEWSVNTDYDDLNGGRKLNELTYKFGIDTDPTMGVAYGALNLGLSNPFDHINVTFADHSIGNNTTGNGLGTEAGIGNPYTTLIANNNVAQNSFNPGTTFSGTALNPHFDPTVPGYYSFYMAAFDGMTELARTDITVKVVPVPAAVWLFGSGLVGLVAFARRRKV